jgi:hypothetical protein
VSNSLVKFAEDGRMKSMGSKGCVYDNTGQTTSISRHEGSGMYAATWLSGSTETGIIVFSGYGSGDIG